MSSAIHFSRDFSISLILLLILLSGCKNSQYQRIQETDSSISQLQFNQAAGFAMPVVPASNPLSDEKISLGRHLFYDLRLSVNQQQSCASCHEQAKAFADGKSLPHGTTGHLLARNSQGLTNVAYNANYTWANPVLTTLEDQILIPLTAEDPIEIGITDSNKFEILQRFRDDENYQLMFTQAFPDEADPYTLRNVIKSLASFNRILISDRSDFDNSQMSESALRGQDIFFSEKADCFHCHGGFNFSLSSKNVNSIAIPSERFFNNGLYNLSQTGDYPSNNNGAYDVSNNDDDKGAFRPPTLRNIELTAPYMHDGSISTLEGVVDFYAAGGRNIETLDDVENIALINQSLGKGADEISHLVGDGRENVNKLKNGFVRGFELSAQEKTDLINFMKSLTDEAFITDPRFSDPFQ